jgi:hypothetical protein
MLQMGRTLYRFDGDWGDQMKTSSVERDGQNVRLE